MAPAPYRIYAVRYAHRQCTTSECFYGDHSHQPMGMDYFVWEVTNGTRTVVVDLGFTEDVPRRNLQNMVLSREPGRLRSLAGSWRSEHDHVQRHPVLSDGLV